MDNVRMYNATDNVRLMHACDSCRKKKIRCDGKRPQCFNCGRQNISGCHYSPVQKRRAKKKSFPERLEDRLHRLERLLKPLVISLTKIDPLLAQHVQNELNADHDPNGSHGHEDSLPDVELSKTVAFGDDMDHMDTLQLDSPVSTKTSDDDMDRKKRSSAQLKKKRKIEKNRRMRGRGNGPVSLMRITGTPTISFDQNQIGRAHV